MNNDFGNIVRDRRKELNITLAELAKKIGSTTSTVSKWERGDVSDVKRQKVVALANVLEIPVEKLFGSNSNEIVSINKVKITTIPIYGSGSDFFSVKNIIGSTGTENEGDIFAYKVRSSDSLINVSKGDIVVVKRDLKLSNGGLYLIRNDCDIIISKICMDADFVMAINEMKPIVKPIKHFDLNILGKIIEIRKPLVL